MFDELFPGTIDQLNKLTVIRYDRLVSYSQQDDSLQENDARCDEKVQRSRYTHPRGKVSSIL